MEITFRDIVILFEPLQSIGKSAIDVLSAVNPKDALVSYRLGKTLRSLRKAYQDYNEFRKKLIMELGKDGRIDPNDNEKVAEFSKRLGDFLDLKPEDLKIYPVKPNDVNVPPVVFEVALFMFEEPKPETGD